jgi:hypothetical protein
VIDEETTNNLPSRYRENYVLSKSSISNDLVKSETGPYWENNNTKISSSIFSLWRKKKINGANYSKQLKQKQEQRKE